MSLGLRRSLALWWCRPLLSMFAMSLVCVGGLSNGVAGPAHAAVAATSDEETLHTLSVTDPGTDTPTLAQARTTDSPAPAPSLGRPTTGDSDGLTVNETLVLSNDTLVPGNFQPTAGHDPDAIAVDAAAGEIFVADADSSVVQFVSTTSGSIIATVPVGASPSALSYVEASGDLWVANAASNNVSVVSVANTTVVATVNVGSYPDGIVDDRGVGQVFVADLDSNNVTVINDTTDRVVGQISGFDGPAGLAYDPVQAEVFVANSGSNNISAVSDVADAIVSNISEPLAPIALAFDGPRDEIFAASTVQDYAGSGINVTIWSNLTVLSALSDGVVATIQLHGGAGAVGYDNRTGQMFVAKTSSSEVAVVSDATNQVVANISLSDYPDGVAVDNRTGQAFVLNEIADDVTVVSDYTDRATGLFGLSMSPWGSASDNHTADLFVANTFSDDLLVISTTTNTVTGTVPVGEFPEAVAFDNRSGDVFVANWLSDSVSVVSASTLTAVANISVGTHPAGLAVDPDNGMILVANSGSANVSVLSDSTDSLLTTIAVGVGPESVAFDGSDGDFYVAEENGPATPHGAFGAVQVISAATETLRGTVSGSVPVPYAIIDDPSTGNLYVGENEQSPFENFGSVTVISGATDSVQATIETSGATDSLTYVNSTGTVLASSYNLFQNPASTVVAISADDGAEQAPVTVGVDPVGMTSVPNAHAVYVSDFGTGTLSVLSFGTPSTSTAYPVTFTESGLPQGINWSVTINRTIWISSSSTLAFFEPNGTYNYSIMACAEENGCQDEYASTTSPGTFSVEGAALFESTTFELPAYAVTFSEEGLPVGTPWSVNLNGAVEGATTDQITFQETNGTYSYFVATSDSQYDIVSGRTGSVSVIGGPRTLGVGFALVFFPVRISETGLPPGTPWTFTLGISGFTVHTPSLTVDEPNGTYNLTLGSVHGYVSISVHTVAVNGAATSIFVTFVPSYSVEFVETGLPEDKNWSVTVDTTTMPSNGTTITVSEPNGSYPFTVAPVSNYTASPSSGVAVVSGRNTPQTIVFTAISPASFSVTFTESGLAPGTHWSVTLQGTTLTVGSTNMTFYEVNGTYDYSIGVVAGYISNPGSGRVIMAGQPQTVAVAFSASTGHSGGGQTPLIDWVAAGAAIAVAILLLEGLTLRRRGNRPPSGELHQQPPNAPVQSAGEARAESPSAPFANFWNRPKDPPT